MEQIKRFMKEEEGLELTEYAVMGALVVAVAVAVVTGLGTAISDRLEELTAHITGN